MRGYEEKDKERLLGLVKSRPSNMQKILNPSTDFIKEAMNKNMNILYYLDFAYSDYEIRLKAINFNNMLLNRIIIFSNITLDELDSYNEVCFQTIASIYKKTVKNWEDEHFLRKLPKGFEKLTKFKKALINLSL